MQAGWLAGGGQAGRAGMAGCATGWRRRASTGCAELRGPYVRTWGRSHFRLTRTRPAVIRQRSDSGWRGRSKAAAPSAGRPRPSEAVRGRGLMKDGKKEWQWGFRVRRGEGGGGREEARKNGQLHEGRPGAGCLSADGTRRSLQRDVRSNRPRPTASRCWPEDAPPVVLGALLADGGSARIG